MLVLRSRLLVWAPMLVVSGDGGRMQGGFTEAMHCGDGGWVVRRVTRVILGVEMLVGCRWSACRLSLAHPDGIGSGGEMWVPKIRS